MLRVGLTGGLGSGKSTVAAMLRQHGAHTLSADEIARELMRPGQPVYGAIVDAFGPSVVEPGGALDRSALARLAFSDGQLEQLNRLVHPAVIAEQARLLEAVARETPGSIAVVESALLFETSHAGPSGWRGRFDCIVLVTAPDDVKIERFADRMVTTTTVPAQRAQFISEARRRLRHQMPDDQKLGMSDFVISNTGSLRELQTQVDRLWPELVSRSQHAPAAPVR